MTEKQESYENLPAVSAGNDNLVPAGNIFFDVGRFELAQRVARVFAESTMVPDHFKGNIGNCLIALNLADRMKCDPFMLLQNMYIVHGKPGIEAKLAIALVNATGKFSPLQYQYNENKSACYAHAKLVATGEPCRGTTVSLKMAQDEGWTGKKGSKWKTMPELMLMYRAAMFFARAYCPEALLGMQTREELQDLSAVDMVASADGSFAAEETTDDLSARILGNEKPEPEPPGPAEPNKPEPPPVDDQDQWYYTQHWMKLRATGFTAFILVKE
jgi:hypothetical protein